MMKTKEELITWFKGQVSIESGLDIEKIDVKESVENFGLDSLSTVSIANDLEEFVGMEVEPTILWEFETIEEIVLWIIEQQNQ